MPASTVVWPDGCTGQDRCTQAKRCLFRCLHIAVRGGREGARMPWPLNPATPLPAPDALAYVRALVAGVEERASTEAKARSKPAPGHLSDEVLRIVYTRLADPKQGFPWDDLARERLTMLDR